MCGIIAYLGKRDAAPVLLRGLKALEYRGYDSAGIAILRGDEVFVEKLAGRVRELEKRVLEHAPPLTKGWVSSIGHTRWATHGAPTDRNAHPHADCGGAVWVVHNGIIENHRELKEELLHRGHTFRSETDTEVVAHLVEEASRAHQTLEEAVRSALSKVRGTYALAVLSRKEPEKIILARNFSPLLVGVAKGEIFAASDATPILPYTKKVIYLHDGEVAVLSRSGARIMDLHSRNAVTRHPTEIDWDHGEVEKGGYRHFMQKEIFEAPEAIENAIRGRNIPSKGIVKLGGLERERERLKKIKKLYIVACGSAYFAGRVGEYLIEELAGLDVETDIASEFRYRNSTLDPKKDALLVISQSGETADTIAALDLAKEKGLLSLGIVNVVGSTIARKTDAGIFQYAGPEIGVATTKAFVSQLALLSLLAIWLGILRKRISSVEATKILAELAVLPEKVKRILAGAGRIANLAAKYKGFANFLYLGRKYSFPIALEGALKLKEISYIHAEAYGAGEMKHGPIALITKDFPTVAISLEDSVYEKTLSNIQEIKARGGPVIAVAFEGDEKIRELADDVIEIPRTEEPLTPILSVIPLQLFAYYIAVALGRDVDKPRNLAKSVTVE